MAKLKTRFVCGECGHESLRWMGKCPGCGEWNTMVEELNIPSGAGVSSTGSLSKPEKLQNIPIERISRSSTGAGELDRVLGGGIVPGSLILIGGDPGIGKSTLLLQISDFIGRSGSKVFYVSGEESSSQIKMRADRLGVKADNLYFVSETNLDVIEKHIDGLKPDIVIIDSIQTVYRPQASSAPGSVSQVREGTSLLMRIAKSRGITIFIVGHVTKEGAIAGPRVLEHMVDTVLYFEGERHHTYRILRTVKNRFGSTNEIGIFEMREEGLVEVQNPSSILLSHGDEPMAGSVVFCSMEGTRPVLVELQALVSTTAFGMPRRMATGIDYNRVILLMAVLEKKVGMSLYNQDAYVNVAGGLKLDEPAADLAVVAAIASSFRNVPIGQDTVVMGEVGLTGEIRGIHQLEKRLMECAKLGFKKCMIPEDNRKGIRIPRGIEMIGVKQVEEALEILLR
ncbi:MAG: DNA repair protein RadA [Clostridia bacterium]